MPVLIFSTVGYIWIPPTLSDVWVIATLSVKGDDTAGSRLISVEELPSRL